MIAAVAFDFDGVVLESTEIKTRAFAELFSGRPEHVDQIVDLHLAHAGISRFEKFRRIHEEILDEPIDDATMARLGDEFSRICWEQLMRCPFVPGAAELLATRSSTHPLFVASGTPQDELRRIAAERGIAAHFSGVYGSPSSKREILERILAERSLSPQELLFVGDATTDLDGARGAGVPFLGRVPEQGPDPFAGSGVPIVADLAELDRDWDELVADPPPVPA